MRIALLVAVIGGLLHIGVLDVAAQETDTGNETTDYQYVFSDSLRLVESNWDGQTWVATFEADRPTDVTITDAGRSSDNNRAVELNRQTPDISASGQTTVRFEVAENRQVTVDGDGQLILIGQDDSIYVLPDGDWTLHGIIFAALLAFVVIVANVLWISRVRKNKVDKVF